MSDVSFDLQRAIYARLRGDDELKTLLGDPARIYDAPPVDAVFPYLTIGETRQRPIAGIDGAAEHDLRIYAFSKYAGRSEVKRIISAVYDALQDSELALNDHSLISLRFVFSDAFARQDGESFSAVTRFRAVTQPIMENA